ncbi:MAG: D-alanyl-D-alanine dipeptidase [Alphaproteobacteria bacterium]|nr:D-alanyl-D-alanine dipeptidase [Alphaproteobacteria bacterium]NDC55756.1 D-alanyl-D-alanine dipeptidase [Alphaproteobacteria bacterium]NDG03928.1 D-alanyl-D-alanine dipeptidase [Alphaproteobacteria bacterium]
MNKPYLSLTIKECGEPLVPIPSGPFLLLEPHAYASLGAPYGHNSPWMARQSVVAGLHAAARELQKKHPGWQLAIFDAYRPRAVQKFMVDRETQHWMSTEGLSHDAAFEKALRIWAMPSDDPATPPLHSTGGAVDVTLADETGALMNMGSPIDENSDRSNPDYFAHAVDDLGQQAHQNRQRLNTLMAAQGFTRHLAEWWHFGLGTQYCAWVQRQQLGGNPVAIYGRADLL